MNITPESRATLLAAQLRHSPVGTTLKEALGGTLAYGELLVAVVVLPVHCVRHLWSLVSDAVMDDDRGLGLGYGLAENRTQFAMSGLFFAGLVYLAVSGFGSGVVKWLESLLLQ